MCRRARPAVVAGIGHCTAADTVVGIELGAAAVRIAGCIAAYTEADTATAAEAAVEGLESSAESKYIESTHPSST